MDYAAIVSDMIDDKIEVARKLLKTKEVCERIAEDLESAHKMYKKQLNRSCHDESILLSAKALDLALHDLEHRLPPILPIDELSSFLRRRRSTTLASCVLRS